MPLQLQIDSSGFLSFSYLSFSIRLKGEIQKLRSLACTLENASVEQIMCVIFIYAYCFR